MLNPYWLFFPDRDYLLGLAIQGIDNLLSETYSKDAIAKECLHQIKLILEILSHYKTVPSILSSNDAAIPNNSNTSMTPNTTNTSNTQNQNQPNTPNTPNTQNTQNAQSTQNTNINAPLNL